MFGGYLSCSSEVGEGIIWTLTKTVGHDVQVRVGGYTTSCNSIMFSTTANHCFAFSLLCDTLMCLQDVWKGLTWLSFLYLYSQTMQPKLIGLETTDSGVFSN